MAKWSQFQFMLRHEQKMTYNDIFEKFFTVKFLFIGFILLLGACNSTTSLTSMAHATVNVIEVTRLSLYRKIEEQWKGKLLSDFQIRYGAPTSQSDDGNPIWEKTITAHIAAHDESSYTGGRFGVTHIWFVPAHDAPRNCSVKLYVQDKSISRLETIEDSAIILDNAPFVHGQESTCQRIFGL